MGLLLHIYSYLFGYEYAKRKFNKKIDLEKEKGKGNRGLKGVKGFRDTLKEIDEKNSKTESRD